MIGSDQIAEASRQAEDPDYAEVAGIDMPALLTTAIGVSIAHLTENFDGTPEGIHASVSAAWAHGFSAGVMAARVEAGAKP